MTPTEPLHPRPFEQNPRAARPIAVAGRVTAGRPSGRPPLLRVLGRTALMWAGTWGVVLGGLSATIEGSGDVIGLDAFWPLIALMAAAAGAVAGTVYGVLRRLVPLPSGWRRAAPDQPLGAGGRLAAAAYGAVTVGGMLVVSGDAIFGVSGAILGACTAFTLPGAADV